MRFATLVLSLITLGGASSTFGADAAKTEIKVSVAAGPTLPLGRAAQRWTQLLADPKEERTWKLYPGAALAARDVARELDAVVEGKALLAVGSALQWSMQVPALGVFALPWIAPQQRELEALARDDALRETIAARLDARGVVLIAIAPLGHREIATTTRPIRRPADVEGLRVRTLASPIVTETLLALKAAPQSMPFAQAQKAFAEGTLDGQGAPATALVAARANESGLTQLTDWGAIGDAMLFVAHRSFWDGLTQADRDMLMRTAAKAIAEVDALAAEEAAIRRLGAGGMSIVRLTPGGHDAFRAAVRDVVDRWRGVIGADVVGLADAALARMRGQASPATK
ncbi:MAG TPA: TRAP transporter substrate-binding protein DctP [Casimicrobiaceae bacterium]|nr:TRAP transporter substrate-binding protein DctP [Casimicrobiaceae bacterium]